MRHGFTLIELMIVIAIIAIIAAIAIPNLLESRVTANESAASASLKSGVFAAETTFKGGASQDCDKDSIGEFGTLGAMCGAVACTNASANQLTMLTGPLATGDLTAAYRVASGYNFVAAVQDMSNQTTIGTAVGAIAVDEPWWTEGLDLSTVPIPAADENDNGGEKYFLVGAAPERYGDTGRRVFIIGQDGQIRSPVEQIATVVWFGGTAATDLDAKPYSVPPGTTGWNAQIQIVYAMDNALSNGSGTGITLGGSTPYPGGGFDMGQGFARTDTNTDYYPVYTK